VFVSKKKTKKTSGFYLFSIARMDRGWPAAGHWEGQLGPG